MSSILSFKRGACNLIISRNNSSALSLLSSFRGGPCHSTTTTTTTRLIRNHHHLAAATYSSLNGGFKNDNYNNATTAAIRFKSTSTRTNPDTSTSTTSTTNTIDDQKQQEQQQQQRDRVIMARNYFSEYVSTGRNANKIFHLLAYSHNSATVSAKDIAFFVSSIDHDQFGNIQINDMARKQLQVEPDAHLTIKDFKNWLIKATKFACSINDRIQDAYVDLPETGEMRNHQQEEQSFIEYTWNETSMSQAVRKMQYAVRGEIVMKAESLQAQGRDILYTNIGNPHAVGQKPITYYRQVLTLCDLPNDYGIHHPNVQQMFPADIIHRAEKIKTVIGECGTGAYTHSQGILDFRKDIVHYIEQRDGHKAYPGNIFLTNGASSGIDMILTCLIAESNDAIMIPIPQYPIYSACIAKLGARQIGYELDESLNWAVTEQELESKMDQALHNGQSVKALVVINPGNPTGQVYTRQDIETIVKFCAKHGIVLLADEVYQANVYKEGKQFVSCKKVALETEGCENLQLISFHSTSKGLIGECGRRGGYMELHHIDPYVQTQIYKLASSGLCSNIDGQIMTSIMVKPPSSNDESYDLFINEQNEIYNTLKTNAKILVDGLNNIDGISCVDAEGSMYAFPRIDGNDSETSFPKKAKQIAEDNAITPDSLFALSLLEETGICVVPASGFGQAKGRIGFRTTFLPPTDKIYKAIDQFKTHHEHFINKYS